jgi:hypothetical protein
MARTDRPARRAVSWRVLFFMFTFNFILAVVIEFSRALSECVGHLTDGYRKPKVLPVHHFVCVFLCFVFPHLLIYPSTVHAVELPKSFFESALIVRTVKG